MNNPSTHTQKAFPGRVIFDHIPKAAGQAVNAWLRKELGDGCVTANLIGSHRELIQRFGGEYSIISGHITFNGEGLDPRYQYITLLREPVSRCLSWISFLLNDVPKAPDTAALINGAKTFMEGRDPNDEFVASLTNYYVNHFSNINVSNLNSNVDQRFDSAFAAIQSYDVVGLYENMQDFIGNVADLINIPAPQSIARVNVTTSHLTQDTISPAIRQRIIGLNQLDIHLYEDIIAWSKSRTPRTNKRGQLLNSPWEKYEPVRNRVLTTQDIPAVRANLREGYDVIHGQLLNFDVDFLLNRHVHELEAGIHIFDENKRWVFGTNSTLQGKVYAGLMTGSLRITHHLIADLPAGKYTAGFDFSERSQDGRHQELAWYDAMIEFRIVYNFVERFAGNNYLPAQMTMQSTTLADDKLVVTMPAGTVTLISPPASMKPSERCNYKVAVQNTGNELWLGDIFRPVNLSYHWYDLAGNRVQYDGLRTALPNGGIAPGKSVDIEMDLLAPSRPGKYQLVITLVQENSGWFEEKGFEATKCEIMIEEREHKP